MLKNILANQKRTWECALIKSGGDKRSPLSEVLSCHFVFNAPFQIGQFTTHAPAEVLAEFLSPLDCVDFGLFAHRGLPRQHRSSEAVAQRYLTCRGHDGCIDSSPESSVRGHTGFVAMVRTSEPVAHKPLGAGSSVLSAKGFTATA